MRGPQARSHGLDDGTEAALVFPCCCHNCVREKSGARRKEFSCSFVVHLVCAHRLFRQLRRLTASVQHHAVREIDLTSLDREVRDAVVDVKAAQLVLQHEVVEKLVVQNP